MADPLSALGALAAASQLAEQCLKMTLFLSSIHSKLRSSREFVDSQVRQVEQLTRISRQIISNPALQTDSIASIVTSCLEETTSLYQSLQNSLISSRDGRLRRLRKSFVALRKKEQIEQRVSNLERLKSLLSLCIEETNSAVIHKGFKNVTDGVQKSQSMVEGTSHSVAKIVDTIPAIFEQLYVIDGQLQCLASHMNNNTNNDHGLSSELNHNLKFVLQKAKGSVASSHFLLRIKTHYHVPQMSNRTFESFKDTIQALRQQILPSAQTSPRMVTLAGVACGGKKQLALEFCHQARNSRSFGAIFWIKASSQQALQRSYKNIANLLKIPSQGSTEAMINAVKNTLATWPYPWLLAFGNYNGGDVLTELGPYIPTSGQGAILITQPLESLPWAERDKAVILPSITLQEGIELLLNICRVEKSDENFEMGLRLVKVMDKNPRFIVEVGNYIKRRRVGLESYYRMFMDGDKRTVAAAVERYQRLSGKGTSISYLSRTAGGSFQG